MKNLQVSEETYKLIKDQLGEEEKVAPSPLEIVNSGNMVGKAFFIRAVTYHMVGRVKAIIEIGGNFFVELEQATWVASSGRFMQALAEGTLDETEPVGQVFINVNAIVDFFPWRHSLNIDQK